LEKSFLSGDSQAGRQKGQGETSMDQEKQYGEPQTQAMYVILNLLIATLKKGKK